MSVAPRHPQPSQQKSPMPLHHLMRIQRGIKHAWFAQELVVLLEQVVRCPAEFARQAGVREDDLRRLMAGEDLDRVSVEALLRVVIHGGLHLQASTCARPAP